MSDSVELKVFNKTCSQILKNSAKFRNLKPEQKTKNYLIGHLNILEENFRKVCELYDAFQGAEEDETVLDECEEKYDDTMETCLSYKAGILDELDRLDSLQFGENSRDESKDGAKSHNRRESFLNNAAKSSNFREIRLPAITPPTFYGDYDNWRPFHDLFVSLIHSNSSLSKIEKLTYLKSCLKGSAASLLDYLEVNNDNYDQAWSILVTRYDHKRILVTTQLKTFFDQPAVSVETADSIKGLLDKSTEVLHALKNLGVPVDSWDVVIIFTLLQKLPAKTQQLWEEKLGLSTELPTFREFSTFLTTRFRSLEVVCQQNSKPKVNSGSSKEQLKLKPKVLHMKSVKKQKYSCAVCHKGQHSLRSCHSFLKLDVPARLKHVKQIGVCENCLAYNHKTFQCPSEKRCFHCNQKHHTLLHSSLIAQNSNFSQNSQNSQSNQANCSSFNSATSNALNTNTNSQSGNSNNNQNTNQINPNAKPFNPSTSQAATSQIYQNYHVANPLSTMVLLATAVIQIQSANGEFISLRALLDPGSESTFITERAVQQLRLKKCRTFMEFSGLGNNKSGSCQSFVDMKIKSLHTSFQTDARAFVLKTITGLLPNREILPDQWGHIQGLCLADPSFYKPSSVDLLLGSGVFSEVVLPEIVRGNEPVAPIAQNTQLGWIVFGNAPIQTCRVHLQLVDIDTQLRKFWEIEESPFEDPETAENIACEEHFKTHTRRLPNGRFEVSLPFKEGVRPALGASQQGALRRFLQLERRFDNNPQLQKEYSACISEYLQLDQMEKVDVSQGEILQSPFHYVVPHHAVFKESSTTTKLRVVFDAAFKTTNGTSLNEHLLVGPKTQSNIMDIILKWRKFKITLTADIEKMYRQIQMKQPDTFYQLIYWRDNKMNPLQLYRLKTVTFGTASAPYLATRTLNKLADDEKDKYPLAAQMIRHDMYVDDLVSGADSVPEAQQKVAEINHLLSLAGFHLRKWASNSEDALINIAPQEREVDFLLPFDSSEHIKTLGIKWLPSSDSFTFQWVQSEATEVTKRTILSTIAKLFDPLGWISPCVISAKIIMQKLWLKGLAWDVPVPLNLQQEWISLRTDLPSLEKIRIPRWICTEKENLELELHGFSDASMKAYGAVVYLRILNRSNKIHTHLVMSKTRVAPLNTVSLPRLELCGAVMLARLLCYVRDVLQLGQIKTYAWTDSTITLCWIAAPPSKWKTFISNRVAEIQRLTNVNIWNHVPTKLNPADLASRGISPSELKVNTLWWRGPEYLQSIWKFSFPSPKTTYETKEEMRSVKVQLHCAIESENQVAKLFHKISDLKKLIRIIAYCRRIVHICLKKLPMNHLIELLTTSELQNATFNCIRAAQKQMFPEEIQNLIKHPSSSKHFGSLHPFIDRNGILRVGGRLQNSNLQFEQQHPVILKPEHVFSKLLIWEAHEKTLHGGLQQMVTNLRTKYWILNLKRSVKKYIHKCVICFRFKAKPMQQLMGNLPAVRVRVSRPFTHTGVDYAGPIEVKSWKGRGGKIYKGYFAIFVCLATKAIHLEAVSDMTTQAFLAAFRRFTARRGVCTEMYSDCGKNFVGANTELQRMMKSAKIDWKQITTTTTNVGTKWNFIPPASPHFGGLWEAGVKSVKFHLKRVVRNETLTFEELSTLLTEIEACLNSRPLCPVSDNLDDFAILTPAHFLFGTSAQLVPEADLAEKVSNLDRWRKIQIAVHSFWKQWSSEYLARLQQRPKWLKTEAQPQIGDLVLLKDERLPPSQWALARIISLVPGKDGLIRVVNIKTQSGEFKRPITKICLLPSNRTADETATI
ncbi:uncharacterized protein LOC129946017 [Eupeodes corollae]|uniref:uncharacterized protein LOC129946017 n=1 Tax=Eupeodes corollae TaxID=290404 RepID=UPI002491BF8B|nr:uncharacterized protein LOC129946017 [Eupeodes corollae]